MLPEQGIWWISVWDVNVGIFNLSLGSIALWDWDCSSENVIKGCSKFESSCVWSIIAFWCRFNRI